MKRSLKKTLKKHFGAASSQSPFPQPVVDQPQRRSPYRVAVIASALTAATLGLASSQPAKALQIFPVTLDGYAPGATQQNIPVTDTFGTSIDVDFSWDGNTENFGLNQPRPSDLVTGGFGGGSILEVQHDPILETETVNLTVDFGGAIEQARLIIIDIDRDNDNTWQDLIQVGGSVAPSAITPATAPSQILEVSPEVLPLVDGIPLGIEPGNSNNGTVPGLAAASDYTVDDVTDGDFIGIFNPRDIDPRLTGAATTTEFTPQDFPTPADVPINPGDGLPNPAAPPDAGVEAQNQSSEGTVTIDYLGSVGTPLTNLTVNYGNGPASVSSAFNPPGGAGFIGGTENGGPGNHGIGIYTIFIVPGSIGTAKSVSSGPTQVSATEFDITYTVRVQNYGNATTLTEVQVTDDLTQTFNGATGFTVVGAPTVVSGPPTLQAGNAAFDGNGNQNLLDGTGSLAPGESALIEYTVRLDTTAANITPGETYNNSVVGAGTTPIGLRITDNSQDDANTPTNPDPDPDGNGDPTEQAPTPVTLPPLGTLTEPNINVAEEAFATDINPTTGPAASFPGNTARVSYRIRVQNTGPERLTNVTLTNDFTQTFDDGLRGGSEEDTGFQIVSVTRSGGNETEQVFNANPAYNGGDSFDGAGNPITSDDVLATGGILNPGEFTEYEILVDVDTTGNGETLTAALPGPFDNFTTATGVGTDLTTPSNITVTDISNDIAGFGSLEAALNPVTNPADPVNDPIDGGSSIDPNNPPVAGSPENIPTAVTINLPAAGPRINVSEQVVNTVLEPTGTFSENTGRVTYRIRVQNTGSEDLQNVLLNNDFTTTFDDGSRGGSEDDTGFEIVEVRQITGSGQTPNAFNVNYDGGDSFENGTGPTNTAPEGDDTLLSGGTLAIGEFSEYEIDVDVDLTGNGETLIDELPGPFDNFTTTQGDGVTSGITVRDISNDATPFNNDLGTALNPPGGSDSGGATTDPGPAPVASDDPAAENVPTPVNLTFPVINVSEEVVSTAINPVGGAFGDNTGRVVYRIRVQNTGFENLRDVTLINDFTNTFDDGSQGGSGEDNGFEIVSVTELTGSGQTPNGFNAAYDGGDTDNFNRIGGEVGPPNTDDDQLLTGGNLDVGQFSEYEITVDVDLTDNGETLITPVPGPFNNSTLATGIGDDPVVPSNIPVADRSNDLNSVNPLPTDLEGALNPDGGSPLGGSVSGDPGVAPTALDPSITDPENVPTPVSFPLDQPQINVSEEVVSTEVNPTGGTYGPTTGRVIYRIRVQNTGVEDLDTVTLTNDFTETFDNGTRGGSGPDNGFEIVSLTQVDGVANAVNPNYDGGDTSEDGAGPTDTNDAELIQPGTLAVGEFSEYEIVVDVDLADNGSTLTTAIPGTFLNSTTTAGIGVGSRIPVRDISNDATGSTLTEALNPNNTSVLGGTVVGNPNEDPNTLTPDVDDLDNTPTPVTLTINPQINVAEEVVDSEVNPPGGAFGSDTGRVTYRIRVQNTGAEDLRDVTLINDFTETFDDGSRGGSGPDNGFEVVSVTQLTGGGQTLNDLNPAYDGGDSDNTNDVGPANTNDNILISGGDLDVGQFSEYEIVVDVNLAENGETLVRAVPGPFENSTLATAIGDDPVDPSNIPVSDRSNDLNSVSPTPNGLEGALIPVDGPPLGGANIGNPGESPLALDPGISGPANTPTPVIFGADLQLVKRITRVFRNGNEFSLASIDEFNDQPETGDTTDTDGNLANLTNQSLPLGLFEVSESLQSGDVIEYTIYFFNPGSSAAGNVQICDPLQANVVLQPESLRLASPVTIPEGGTVSFADSAFAPSNSLIPQRPGAPAVESCSEDFTVNGTFPAGTTAAELALDVGGGVVLNLTTVEENTVGAFRFTVAIP